MPDLEQISKQLNRKFDHPARFGRIGILAEQAISLGMEFSQTFEGNYQVSEPAAPEPVSPWEAYKDIDFDPSHVGFFIDSKGLHHFYVGLKQAERFSRSKGMKPYWLQKAMHTVLSGLPNSMLLLEADPDRPGHPKVLGIDVAHLGEAGKMVEAGVDNTPLRESQVSYYERWRLWYIFRELSPVEKNIFADFTKAVLVGKKVS